MGSSTRSRRHESKDISERDEASPSVRHRPDSADVIHTCPHTGGSSRVPSAKCATFVPGAPKALGIESLPHLKVVLEMSVFDIYCPSIPCAPLLRLEAIYNRPPQYITPIFGVVSQHNVLKTIFISISCSPPPPRLSHLYRTTSALRKISVHGISPMHRGILP